MLERSAAARQKRKRGAAGGGHRRSAGPPLRVAIAVAVANDGRSDGRAMTGTMQQPLSHVERGASGEAKHRSAAQAGAVGAAPEERGAHSRCVRGEDVVNKEGCFETQSERHLQATHGFNRRRKLQRRTTLGERVQIFRGRGTPPAFRIDDGFGAPRKKWSATNHPPPWHRQRPIHLSQSDNVLGGGQRNSTSGACQRKNEVN